MTLATFYVKTYSRAFQNPTTTIPGSDAQGYLLVAHRALVEKATCIKMELISFATGAIMLTVRP